MGRGKQVVAWILREMLNGQTTERYSVVSEEEGRNVYSKQSKN
jgi:hypothetical protein